MKKFLAFFLIVVATAYCSHIFPGPRHPVAPSGSLVSEDFEVSGTQTGWTDTGTIGWGYTTTPLVGSKSIQLTGAVSTRYTTNFAPQSDCWLFIWYRKDQLTTNSNHAMVSLQSSTGSNLCYLASRASPDATERIYCGTVNSATASHSISTGRAMWIHYIASTGTNNGHADVYFSANETMPGSPSVSISTGDTTGSVASVSIQGDTNGITVYDKLRVSASPIGSNPP